jgi:glycosyltransferase involved in cell wall biosynthesis
MPKNKINIAFVIDRFAIGGTENQLADLIRKLDKSKFKLFLICLQPTDYFQKIDLPCEKIILNVHSLVTIKSLVKLVYYSFWLRKNKIRIIQCFFFDATLYSLIAAKILPGIKVISSKRDLGYWYTPQLLKILIRMRYFIDLYIVNSRAIHDVIKKKERIATRKIQVIYNGIKVPDAIADTTKDSIRKTYSLEETDKIIGIVANLNRPVKRVELLIKAASILTQKRDDLKFFIIGGGHLKPELIQLGVDLGVNDRIIFTGLQPNPLPFISLFDIGVLCSDSEGFSNSIIEYMTFGVPVIAADSGGNREIIANSKNGFLFEPGNFDSLANLIEQLLDNKKLRNTISKNNRKDSSKYYWDNIIKKHEQVFFSLLT